MFTVSFAELDIRGEDVGLSNQIIKRHTGLNSYNIGDDTLKYVHESSVFHYNRTIETLNRDA